MAQLKIVLAVLKRHHFWALCGVVVAAAVPLWLQATTSLKDARATATGEINGWCTGMDAIANQQNHPNEESIKTVADQTLRLKQDVLQAWQRLYQEQKGKNPLPDVLTQKFKDEFMGDPPGEISWSCRDEYMNNIGRHIPKLFEMVDVLRPAGTTGVPEPGSAGLGSGGGTGLLNANRGGRGDGGSSLSPRTSQSLQDDVEMVGVVDWLEDDRLRLVNRFNWPYRPSTLDVRLAQEDLWVYEALLRIIRNTNSTETGELVNSPQEARVKQILTLEIGAEAVKTWQTLARGGFLAAEPSGGQADASSSGSTASAPGDTVLGEGRYVDADGQPLADGQAHPFAEFRLMPIHLVLVMKQTSLPKLLVECANSSMPVEVRRLTLGADPGMASSQAGRLGGGLSSDGGSSRFGGGSAAAMASDLQNTEDIQVEILGTICIYNPPDKDKLGTGTAAAAAPIEPPAAAPPPVEG
jgi:hypothetical protein